MWGEHRREDCATAAAAAARHGGHIPPAAQPLRCVRPLSGLRLVPRRVGRGSSPLGEGSLPATHPRWRLGAGGRGVMRTGRASVTRRPVAAAPDWAVLLGVGAVDATKGADGRRRSVSPCGIYRPSDGRTCELLVSSEQAGELSTWLAEGRRGGGAGGRTR